MISRSLRYLSAELLDCSMALLQGNMKQAQEAVYRAQYHLQDASEVINRIEAPIHDAAIRNAHERVIASIEAEARKALWP